VAVSVAVAVVSVVAVAGSEAAAPREAGDVTLFDAQGLARIERAIADAEQRTRGELVVLEVGRAETYRDLRLLYAGGLALAGAAIAHLVDPELSVTLLLWLQLGLGVLIHGLLGYGPLLRPLLPAARATQAAEQRAQLELVEHGVLSTRERTGVLILLCALEHRVVILGDQGIHALVREGWQAHVDRIVKGIREGRAADGVCEVVAALGAVLAAELPPREDNPDELPNAVRSERE
jgi:putative membrane protein